MIQIWNRNLSLIIQNFEKKKSFPWNSFQKNRCGIANQKMIETIRILVCFYASYWTYLITFQDFCYLFPFAGASFPMCDQKNEIRFNFFTSKIDFRASIETSIELSTSFITSRGS